MKEGAVVVDTDCGIDDFAALALLSRSSVAVDSVLVGFGNVSVARGVAAASLLFPTRVHAGCEQPLVSHGKALAPWPGHGSDGLGEQFQAVSKLLGSASMLEPAPLEHAAARLVSVCRSSAPRSLALLLLGPCTNVAVALALDSASLDRAVARVVIMGGALLGKGNSSWAAEFNFRADPEAANNVLKAFGSRVELVPWETTVAAPLPLSWTRFRTFGFFCKILRL
jgi:purine nucleosidase